MTEHSKINCGFQPVAHLDRPWITFHFLTLARQQLDKGSLPEITLVDALGLAYATYLNVYTYNAFQTYWQSTYSLRNEITEGYERDV